MLNSSTGIFSFQFSSMDGLDKMLENCPWFIRNNPLILKMWNPDVNLLKEDVGNVPVWVKLHGVPVTAFSEDGLRDLVTKLELIEVRADVELKDNIVVDMPKLVGEGSYTCNLRVEYEWKPPQNMKKPSQTPRGVPVGPKVGFKPAKQVYRQVSKKNNVNTSGNKKKDVEPTIEVSNSNPFDVLNSVENDMANFLASKKVGYGTNSLLEQWKESYVNGDYDFDPYDDDMYEGQDIPDKI
ncbi:retrotransposon protein, putative, ty1-copia subclass [Tanacetum coccineum]